MLRPDSILAVTFTNKASAEMAERVDHLLQHRSLAKPLLATFHSFCVRVLRRDIEALRIGNEGLTRSFVIYDEADQQAIVKQAMRRMGLDTKQLTPRTVLSRISWAKNHMLDPQEIYLQSTDPVAERIAHIYEIYRKELRKANALDFDDLLLEAVRLLRSSAEVRERYNRRYRYLLIDEYQDTNRPQYELMKLLAGAEHNVCVVGDEDQSIYSWRGADIRNILEFEKDFPEAKTIRLEQNYRSTQVILEGASAVVARNLQRKGKNLWTSREGGAMIGYYEAPDGENEALFIADYIQKYMRRAGEEHDLPRAAVLYRTNSQSRLVEEALRRYGIAYTMVGGFSFYDRSEIKDLLSYLKLVQNPDDSIALARVINTPARGIGKTTLEILDRLSVETGMSTWGAIEQALKERLLPARACVALATFRRLIEDARALLEPGFAEKLTQDVVPEQEPCAVDAAETDASEWEDVGFDFGDLEPEEDAEEQPLPLLTFDEAEKVPLPPVDPVANEGFRKPGDAATLPELIRFLIDRTGYIRSLEEEGTPEAFSRIENLKELANAAQDAQQRGETLSEFLDHAALVSDTDRYNPESRVTLMSLHSAKGLEFPLVLAGGHGRGIVSSFENAQSTDGARRGAAALLRWHDAGYGCAGGDASALSPQVRERYAGSQSALALPGRDSGASVAGSDSKPAALRRRIRRALSLRPRRIGIVPALQLRRRGPASQRRLPAPSLAASRFPGQHRPVFLFAQEWWEPAEARNPHPRGSDRISQRPACTPS